MSSNNNNQGGQRYPQGQGRSDSYLYDDRLQQQYTTRPTMQTQQGGYRSPYGPNPDFRSQHSAAGSYGPPVDDARRSQQDYDRWVRAQYARDLPGVSAASVPPRNSNSSQLARFDVTFANQPSQGYRSTYAPEIDPRDFEEPRSHGQSKTPPRKNSGGRWK